MIKLILVTISIFIIPGAAVGLYLGTVKLYNNSQVFNPLLIGIFLGILTYLLFLRKWEAFNVFEHEFTHAIVALCFFRKVKKFVVTKRSGGYVSYSPGFGGEFANAIITLAPYFLPTFTIFAIILRNFIPLNWFPWYDGFTGLTFGYHLISNFDEIRQNWNKNTFYLAGTGTKSQTDIGKYGYISAFFVICAATLFIHGLIVWGFTAKSSGILTYLKIIYDYAAILYNYLLNATILLFEFVKSQFN